MAKKDSSKKPKSAKPETAPKTISVGGNVEKSVVIDGNNNVVHYYEAVSTNTEKHEPDYWNLKHPYPMPPNFTGRVAERVMLTQWLNGDSENRLFILRALGGFGKSALTWHWLTHDVDIKEWPKVVFWSFYEGDASFEHFIEETLKYLNLDVPQGKRDQVDALLHTMQADNILLIMDGFERVLRAYSSMSAAYQGDEEPKLDDTLLDCVDANAETFLKSVCSLPNIKGKVLMTTRLTPRTVKPRGELMLGCHEEELTAMEKADAVEFFHKQGIKGNRVEIESACEPYGYHPLSLRLLAGRILKDLHNPGDISVAQTIKIDGDLKQHQNHVLKVAYESLSAQQQILLGQIACFRSPIAFDTLATISKPVVEKKSRGLAGLFKKKAKSGNLYNGNIESDLQNLIERGILQHDSKDKYDLHPIVRRFAYDQLTISDRTAAHTRLVNYFDAVPTPEKVEKLEDLAPVIELYHHTVRAGKLDEAFVLFRDRLSQATYYQFGAYQLRIELLRTLFLDSEDKPPRLKEESAQAWTLVGLANTYSMSGQPRRAIPLYKMQIAIREKEGNKKNIAIGLGAVASVALLPIGALSEAERNLRRSIDLCREISESRKESHDHIELMHVLAYCGMWNEFEDESKQALEMSKEQNDIQAQSPLYSYRSLRFLLMARANSQSKIENLKSSIECAQRALELADETAKTRYSHPRDYVRAHWLLGAAYRAVSTAKRSTTDDLALAEENLSKALNLCRQINMVDHEANILLDLARLRYTQGDFKDAQEKASEALVITERSGYVLQGADVNLFLTELAMSGHRSKVEGQLSDKDAAIFHAKEALRLATCDGPPYYYKVAYEEAERMLKRLNDEG